MIYGQEKIKNNVERIFTIFKHSSACIKPHFILTGGSGTGKTHIIKTISNKLDINFIEINAAQLTKEGTSGNSLSKALSPLSNCGNKLNIIFVDEFDKLFISGNSNSELAHETTNGVQNEFLKVLENNETSVFGDYGKYVSVPTSNCLFVFAGAFNGQPEITIDDLRNFGIKTEFLGRVGLVYNTEALNLSAMYEILDGSPLLDNYLHLFLDIPRDAVITSMREWIASYFHQNTLGARQIDTLIHHFFIKGSLPTENETKQVVFTKMKM